MRCGLLQKDRFESLLVIPLFHFRLEQRHKMYLSFSHCFVWSLHAFNWCSGLFFCLSVVLSLFRDTPKERTSARVIPLPYRLSNKRSILFSRFVSSFGRLFSNTSLRRIELPERPLSCALSIPFPVQVVCSVSAHDSPPFLLVITTRDFVPR